jgi:hemerythrin-like domain-containing protein
MLPNPAPDFDDPLAMLRACHERIRRQCVTLSRLATHLQEHGPDDDARQAAAEVHRYFNTAGRHHHEDEERDLFPLLRDDPRLAAVVDSLQQEHDDMERLWRELEPQLAAPAAITDRDAFERTVEAFGALYARHIAREEADLLPAAEQRLSDAQRRELGRRMAARRGVSR